jgi:hypothetical protein
VSLEGDMPPIDITRNCAGSFLRRSGWLITHSSHIGPAAKTVTGDGSYCRPIAPPHALTFGSLLEANSTSCRTVRSPQRNTVQPARGRHKVPSHGPTSAFLSASKTTLWAPIDSSPSDEPVQCRSKLHLREIRCRTTGHQQNAGLPPRRLSQNSAQTPDSRVNNSRDVIQ